MLKSSKTRSWLKEPSMKTWMIKEMNYTKEAFYPWCKACDIFLRNKKDSIVSHSKVAKHITSLTKLMEKESQQSSLSNFFNDPVRSQAMAIEARFCLVMAQKIFQWE